MSERKARLSIAQQWLLIATVTLVPLLTVVGYASWSLYQQMLYQRSMVQVIDQASQVQAAIGELTRDLERAARQYRLLRDTRFLDLYEEKREGLYSTRIELARLLERDMPGTAPPVLVGLDTHQQPPLRIALHTIEQMLDYLSRQSLPDIADEDFTLLTAELSEFRRRFDQQASTHIHNLSEAGENQLESVLWRLSLLGLITLPVTLILIGLGFWQMIKPVRRLSSAIRNLGHGDWQSPIQVRGPKDLQSLGERLEWLRGQLLQADRQKQVFLRHVSHELKTPLSAIVEAVSLLDDEVPGPLTERQRQVLGILQGNADSLRELIQQLLNYNVITQGFQVRTRQIHLPELCAKISARYDVPGASHWVFWDITGQPETLESEPQLLEMILCNLFSNAYYYSPAGGRITVRWVIVDERCQISVADQGPGIAIEDQERIFEPFAQGAARRHGPVQGSGVGLAIVREAVHSLGGELRLTSTPGAGSRFDIHFPLSLVDKAQVRHQSEPEHI